MQFCLNFCALARIKYVKTHFHFQDKCIKFREEADKAEIENISICKILDELRTGVSQLFKVTKGKWVCMLYSRKITVTKYLSTFSVVL